MFETFSDANGDGIGDFQGLTNKLDYLASLKNITCLWLLPFYPSPNRDNGYDVTDFYGIAFVAIAFELLHKTLAALAGAIAAVTATLLFGVFHAERPYSEVHDFVDFVAHDLGVIGVIVGTSILVEIAAASGLLHFVAIKLVKLTGVKTFTVAADGLCRDTGLRYVSYSRTGCAHHVFTRAGDHQSTGL